MVWKEGLNEIQILTEGKSYSQIVGLRCFHPTNHREALSKIVSAYLSRRVPSESSEAETYLQFPETIPLIW
jgi:hypothetical protein